jgi:AbrB family looped-hinge helix DNA binding protein
VEDSQEMEKLKKLTSFNFLLKLSNMNEFRIKLGNDGRILIPAFCRHQLQLQPGEELIIRVEDRELHLTSLKDSLNKAQRLVKQLAKGQSLVDKLIKMRHDEQDNE